MRTISRDNITHTSFNQVLAAHAIAAYRNEMNPKQLELSNLLQNYLNSNGDANDAELAVKYLENVQETNRVSFEVFAFNKALDIEVDAELQVNNSLLPADNLILLSAQRYDSFSKSNDSNRPHTLRIRDQKQFSALFHHCQLFILAWLTKQNMPYDRYTFQKVIVDSCVAWRNFLAGAGITLDLPAAMGGFEGMHEDLQYKNGKGQLTACIWTKFVNKHSVLKS